MTRATVGRTTARRPGPAVPGLFWLGLIGLVGSCADGLPTFGAGNTRGPLGRADQPRFSAFDCSQPVKSKVYMTDGRCMPAATKGKVPVPATVVQRLVETTMEGWKCSLRVTSHVHYCGIASYTQALPVSETDVPRQVTVGECSHWVRRQAVFHPHGGEHKVNVP